MTERSRGLSDQDSSGQASVPRTVPSLGAKRSVPVRKRSVAGLAGRSRSYETKPLSTTPGGETPPQLLTGGMYRTRFPGHTFVLCRLA